MATKATKASTNGHVNRVAEALESMGGEQAVRVTAPNFRTAEFKVIGTAPYVQLKFGEKARNMMRATQAAGSTAKKGKKREAKDFDGLFLSAQHISADGWNGVPASAFRHAMVEACTLVDFHKTKAKKAVFIDADGYDKDDGMPLVRIHGRKPRHVEHPVPNANGAMDIRVRAMFDEGWTATLRVTFDADLFTLTDITNLLMRAGMQVGVGEGRPSSKNSIGMGWGTFSIEGGKS
jgi:hypothetical protein